LILHSLRQFDNFSGSNFGSKWVQISRDVRDHSQCSSAVSRCEMQVHSHYLAPVTVPHPHIVKRHTVTGAIRNAVMPQRVHPKSP